MRNIELGRKLVLRLCCLVIAITAAGTRCATAAPTAPMYDVVIYGATPSGIIAAVTASRHGLHVALLEPSQHIGGMMAGGLSYTDRGNIETIGGIPREFFSRVGAHYGEPATWGFEPHVADQVFHDMLQEAKVEVFLGMRLREKSGVTKKENRIVALTMENAKTFAGKEFADCTYEGDLMAQAGVSVTWGRESRAEYGESLAGVLPSQRLDLQFRTKVSPTGAMANCFRWSRRYRVVTMAQAISGSHPITTGFA